MRKLPQDFAFPLGLGSKKHNSSHTAPADGHKTNHNSNTMPSSSNGDTSPRAPCQDLDTINL